MKVQTRRERFLSESLKLIHEKGFKATTLRDIAQKLDFEVGNIYNYIPSKQALLEGYLFEISGEFHHGIDHIIASTYSPREKLKAVIKLHVELTSRKPYEVALLVNEWRNLTEPRLGDFLKEKAGYEAKVRSIIEEALQAGEIRSLETTLATQTFLASVRWLYDWYIDHSEKANPIELEKQITDFVFLGLGNDHS